MFRRKKGSIILILSIILISISLVHISPAYAQFPNITFTPLFPSFMYGGIFNPFLTNLGTTFTPFGFNYLGMNSPFFNLNSSENGILSNYSNLLLNPVTSPLSILDSFSIPNYLQLLQMPYGGLTGNLIMPNMLTPATLSLAAPFPMRGAAQTGNWIGTWQSTSIAFIILFNSGTMNMTLIENPTLSTIDGTAILIGSRFADTLFDVRGVLTDPTSFVLEGIVAPGNALVLNCTLTSPTTMIGSYTVSFGFGGQVVDTGVFSLTLV